jgi:hypothetical protein
LRKNIDSFVGLASLLEDAREHEQVVCAGSFASERRLSLVQVHLGLSMLAQHVCKHLAAD